ncbi:MAG: NUDIX hydrolase [Gemmatimonadaceae bacterium]|nr:NUDIX hydrolase [Gemmatimonadaceae bacterium]
MSGALGAGSGDGDGRDGRGELLARQTRFEGPVFRLDADDVRFPNGTTGHLDIVRHPGASAIIPFLSDPRGADPQVLLIRQFRWAANDVLYEIPAGRLNPGETPLECAAREVREETGCAAGRLEFLYTVYTTPGFTDETLHLYLATDLVAATTDGKDADEFIEVERVTLSQALEMIRTGAIKDMKTMAALLYVAGYIAGR